MHKTTANGTSPSEVSILARVLGNEEGQLPRGLARYILTLGFGERDKARMHDLAAKARAGTLTPEEQAEIDAYSRVGSLIGILHSKARRALKGRPGTNGKPRTH